MELQEQTTAPRVPDSKRRESLEPRKEEAWLPREERTRGGQDHGKKDGEDHTTSWRRKSPPPVVWSDCDLNRMVTLCASKPIGCVDTRTDIAGFLGHQVAGQA